MRPACAILDAAALRANLAVVKRRAPHARVMAVAKANGYGHGLVFVARALRGVDAFGVASLEEGLELREAGICEGICLLEGFFDPGEIGALIRFGLTPVLHEDYQIEALEACHLEGPLDVWIKIDTGMHRLGFPPGRLPEIVARLRRIRLIRQAGVMSHLAAADDQTSPATKRQITVMTDACGGLVKKSLANSAGILCWPESHGDWVRPGLMLYGASPLPGQTGSELGLSPVMTLKSRLISVRTRDAGDTLGYGGTYCCPEEMPVGVAAIGYGDGYPRELAPGTPVRIHDRLAPIIGRVSMDMLSIDLRGIPGVRVGDEVVLWGKGLPVERIAEAAGTIPYTLLCGLTQRLPRREAP
ncbi:MAG: alanine racemase [Gammaproteobacteria bacterium]|nr:alanine racemase [Gammaproteobacteria bacterium]